MDPKDLPVEDFGAAWAKAKVVLAANEGAAAPYLAGLSLELLDEFVQTALGLLQRPRAPRGFGPVFQVARASAALALRDARRASDSVSASDFSAITGLVVALTQLVSANAAMSIFGDRSEEELTLVGLSSRLSEALSLLNTAQSELAAKKSLLETSVSLADSLAARQAALDTTQTRAEEAAEAAAEHDGEIQALLATAKTHEATLKASGERAVALVADVEKQKAAQAALTTTLQSLQERCLAQQATIDGLLPKGASAGLAYAFGQRKAQLERTKWLWMSVFIASILGLAVLGYRLTSVPLATSEDLWRQILHRLPLLAPLVWIGWFSAVQYGNTIRIQEDYAFKEATSKAFVGYRDHMAFMQQVSDVEGATALRLMVARTISILGTEPLRSLQAPHRDASPANSILETARDWFGHGRGPDPTAGSGSGQAV